MTEADIELILESLSFTREHIRNYTYPTHEMHQDRMSDVNHALASVRAIRNEGKSA